MMINYDHADNNDDTPAECCQWQILNLSFAENLFLLQEVQKKTEKGHRKHIREAVLCFSPRSQGRAVPVKEGGRTVRQTWLPTPSYCPLGTGQWKRELKTNCDTRLKTCCNFANIFRIWIKNLQMGWKIRSQAGWIQILSSKVRAPIFTFAWKMERILKIYIALFAA